MKESYWGYWLVMLGILVIGVMLLISSTTTGTTQDYYELKETASASMVDAVDYSYYRLYGDLKISKEKFIENFIRRFSESATMTKEYNISFYDIHEVPPKVSVKISSVSNSVNIANTTDNSFDLVNKIDMVLVGGSEGTNASQTSDDPVQKCLTYTAYPAFASVLQEVLNTKKSSKIDSALTSRIINANLENLKKWAAKKGNVKDNDYYSEFIKAMILDFGTSFGRDAENEFIESDPTRPSNTPLTDDNRTAGILGYALEYSKLSGGTEKWLEKAGSGS